jgi:hypothetical protein
MGVTYDAGALISADRGERRIWGPPSRRPPERSQGPATEASSSARA